MNDVLARWNHLPVEAAEQEILPCNGSRAWAHAMAAQRPFADGTALAAVSDQKWNALLEEDWLEAFASHPRIGDSAAPAGAKPQSKAWSQQEQRSVSEEEDAVKHALAEGNREYEQRFGRIFIVCATGKSGSEMLAILRRRLHNDAATELREAAEQQRQITQIRLKKWLGE
jgi:2-oxo-4-hydroxy-4-carboxy-5-ureidoimidazoline decarboxylase